MIYSRYSYLIPSVGGLASILAKINPLAVELLFAFAAHFSNCVFKVVTISNIFSDNVLKNTNDDWHASGAQHAVEFALVLFDRQLCDCDKYDGISF